jgi:hypothetical protein
VPEHVRWELPPDPDRPRFTPTEDYTLNWLASCQQEDGSWEGDPKATGLAILCFLGAGEIHTRGHYQTVVREGLRWLFRSRGEDGTFGATGDHAGHAIATLALCEAYAMTASPILKPRAQAGLDGIARLGPQPDSSTVWMLLALYSGKLCGLRVDRSRFVRAWEAVRDPEGSPYPPCTVPALTAAEVLCRNLAGERPQEGGPVRPLAEWIALNPPVREEGKIDLAYWWLGTLAMYQSGGDYWKAWSGHLRSQIIDGRRNRMDDPLRGSWDPVGPGADSLGRVGATALQHLCLLVYYRYARVFGVYRED